MFCYQYFARIVFQQCASVGEAIPAICRDLLTNLFGVAAVESIRFLVIQLQNKISAQEVSLKLGAPNPFVNR
jgi:hypothetical protein